MILDNDNSSNKFRYLWIISLIVLLLFLNKYMDLVLTSDDASELIFAKYLSQGWNIFSTGWYYSTEVRVIYTQIVYGLLFKLMDNWHNVRLLGNAILILLTLSAIRFLLCSAGIKKYFPWIALLFVTPVFWSNLDCHYIFTIVGAYYLPHISFLVLLLGLFFGYIRGNGHSYYLYVAAVLSFLASLEGTRLLFIFQLPLVANVGILYLRSKFWGGGSYAWRRLCVFLGFNMLAALVALFINRRVFPSIFSYADMDAFSFIGFDIQKALLVLKGYLANFGFISNVALQPIDILVNISCIIFVSLAVYGHYLVFKNNQYRNSPLELMAIYNIVMLGLYIALFSMTSMYYMNRYVLQTVIIIYPFMLVPFLETEIKNTFRFSISLVVMMALLSTVNFYKNVINTDINKDNRAVVKILQDKGYSNGYATFWNGNILTELSNGSIEIWTLRYKFYETRKLDDLYTWLQKKEHSVQKPQGKVFLYLDSQEIKKAIFLQNLGKEHILYRSKEYALYGFKSYEQLKKLFDQK